MSRDHWGSQEYDAEAQRLYDEGRYRAALTLLSEAVERHPGSAALRVSLGYTYLARESFAWARVEFERALEIEPDHEEALVGLGDALLKFGERARALLAFERVLELGFGDDPGLTVAVARALYREGLYERALRYYRMAGERAEAAAERGYTLYQLGRREEALAALRSALEKDPELYEARVFYGNLLYDGGDYEGALLHFVQVPPDENWDPLAVWRTVELLRGFRGLPADADTVEPYLGRLEALSAEPSPEERLLASVEASGSEGRGGVRGEREQLDLFVLESSEPEGRDPEVHTVRARNGRVYRGDWLDILVALRDDSDDPEVPVSKFMRDTARLVRNLTGIEVPDDDPEAFLRASARAGLFEIEE